MPTVQELIVTAIEKRLIVTAQYQGFERVMCPHVIGYKVTKKHGRRVNALFFQFAGGSSSGLPPEGEWRCVVVDELLNVKVGPGQWHTGPSHTRPQTCVDVHSIIAEVPY